LPLDGTVKSSADGGRAWSDDLTHPLDATDRIGFLVTIAVRSQA